MLLRVKKFHRAAASLSATLNSELVRDIVEGDVSMKFEGNLL